MDQSSTEPSSEDLVREQSGEAYGWYVVFVLSLAGIVSLFDRQVINLLVEPIKADLGISDVQISLLQGFAFVFFHTLLAIPLARLADSWNRNYVISLGIVAWSIGTAACSLVRTFPQFFFARMFVGAGEATLTPAGFSLISDCFTKKRVTLPLAVFTGSSFLGSGIALLFGAWLISQVQSMGNIIVPLVGEIRPWQLVFLFAALPAILLLPLMRTVREPRREVQIPATNRVSGDDADYSLRAIAQFVRTNWKALAPVLIGFPLLAAAQFSLGAWVPTFFIRTFGWTASEIGYAYGLIVVCFGYLGIVSGGWLANLLLKRGYDDANMMTALFAALAAIPLFATFSMVSNAYLSLTLLAPLSFLGTVPFGVGSAALAIMVPDRMRAQMIAVYLLLATLVGQGMGPSTIAMVTDYVFGDPNMLGYSIAIVGPVLIALACAIIFFSLGPYRASLKKVFEN